MDSGLMQSLTAGIIVLAAGVFLGRRAWRTLSSAKRAGAHDASCGSGGACGCSGVSESTPGKTNSFDTTAR
jgi:hypothetical protein